MEQFSQLNRALNAENKNTIQGLVNDSVKSIQAQAVKINTLADFKRAIQTGAKLETVWHQSKFAGRDEKGHAIYTAEFKPAREVKTVQGNAFTLLTTNKDGNVIESWLHFPKAKDFEANGTSEVKIYDTINEQRTLFLTYKFI